jgi:hypothetical protein
MINKFVLNELLGTYVNKNDGGWFDDCLIIKCMINQSFVPSLCTYIKNATSFLDC